MSALFSSFLSSANAALEAVKSDASSAEHGAVGRGAPKPALRVEILRTRPNSADGSTGYEIEVTFGRRQWVIQRRYSEFDAFHNRHVVTLFGADQLPQLPPKKICGNKDAQFVAQRKRHLSVYLQHLLKDNRVRATRATREFFSDAHQTRITALFKTHIPLLRRGARFEKIGTVFTRDVWVELSEDFTRLDYWQAGLERGAVDEVKSLAVYTISHVGETPERDAISVSAEREAVFSAPRLHLRWLAALRELADLLHLFHPDAQVVEVERKKKQQTALRNVTLGRERAKRAAKRQSLKEKYKR